MKKRDKWQERDERREGKGREEEESVQWWGVELKEDKGVSLREISDGANFLGERDEMERDWNSKPNLYTTQGWTYCAVILSASNSILNHFF